MIHLKQIKLTVAVIKVKNVKQKYFDLNIIAMQETDEEMKLINCEVKKIYNSSRVKDPFIINSFSRQFDEILNQLTLEYTFNFDKIALHLYYQFPQFQQKINYKTVTFRWWQIHASKNIDDCQLSEKNALFNSDKAVKETQIDDQVQTFQRDLRQFQEKPSKYQSVLALSTQSYSKALQKSLILTQQQSQRLILYKPKFIVDTDYQLERYQVNLQQQGIYSDTSDNLSSLVIEKFLKKVVSNQFEYDEFGWFKREQDPNNFKKFYKKQQKKWGQLNDESSDQNFSQEQDSTLEKSFQSRQKLVLRVYSKCASNEFENALLNAEKTEKQQFKQDLSQD